MNCELFLPDDFILGKDRPLLADTFVAVFGFARTAHAGAESAPHALFKGIFPAAVERAFAESDEVLVEECIRGREMGCGVLIAGGREYLLPITEIRPKKEFFDFQAKYEAGYSDEITPAEIAPQTAAELHRLALAAYKACRCRGIVRVDFIVTPEGRPYLIEINTIPGMSASSIVPKQVRAAGMTLGELYDLIIADTCGRKP